LRTPDASADPGLFARQLEVLQAASARLSRAEGTEAVGRAIVEETGRIIDYHNARVYVLEPPDALVPIAFEGRVGEYDKVDFDLLRTNLGHGFTGWVGQHGEALLVPDANDDPRGASIPGTDDVDESMLVVPMRYDDAVVGVITLSKLGLNGFDAHDLRLLSILADQAATALESARNIAIFVAATTPILIETWSGIWEELRASRGWSLPSRPPSALLRGVTVVALLVIAGAANGVNLTDGVDGLAAGTVIIALFTFASMIVISWIRSGPPGHRFDTKLDLAIVAAALIGGTIGFLWYNAWPAEVFMGDTGSMALGGALASFAIFTKTIFLLLLIGGIFALAALSVIIQVFSFKYFKRRVFLMAPIQHHFELKAWSETKIMVRFWIVTGILCAIGFALYYRYFTGFR
jgi:UDP-N-acetylmuramyl pentapeptide phosphotransferase/UDP-N-acetylglucosamine-1-phosphate transferase